MISQANYGVIPVGRGFVIENATVSHCERGILLASDNLEGPEIRGGVFEFNGDPNVAGGYVVLKVHCLYRTSQQEDLLTIAACPDTQFTLEHLELSSLPQQ